jgi:hypothetical protein
MGVAGFFFGRNALTTDGPSQARTMVLERLSQVPTLSSEVRRDIKIFIAAIVFLVVVYFLSRWLA